MANRLTQMATRTGACAFDGFRPWRSPTASAAAFSDSASHAHVAYASITPSSTSAAGDFMALPHACSSMTGSSRNKKSTMPGTSSRRFTRSCTSGAMTRTISVPRHASGSHGAARSMNSSTGSARMYSPLMAVILPRWLRWEH